VFEKASLRSAREHLIKADVRLSKVIDHIGPCEELARPRQPAFDALAGAILSQQLSAKAAGSIIRRIGLDCGISRPFEASVWIDADEERLRGAGVSRSKVSYIKAVASQVISGRLSLQEIESLPDEDAMNALVALKGVGHWTAEMVLLFGMGRMDVLALSDAGLRRAVRDVYGLSQEELTDSRFQEIAEPWRPYRSVASWYLWRHVDQR
jgi:DNA-3-methyladenine glycosylase II